MWEVSPIQITQAIKLYFRSIHPASSENVTSDPDLQHLFTSFDKLSDKITKIPYIFVEYVNLLMGLNWPTVCTLTTHSAVMSYYKRYEGGGGDKSLAL
jgi:hypothetical protein